MNTTVDPEPRVLAMLHSLTAVAIADIKPEDRLREDLGIDSVASMELLSMLSEELNVDVEMEDAVGIDTVGQVLALVRDRLPHA